MRLIKPNISILRFFRFFHVFANHLFIRTMNKMRALWLTEHVALREKIGALSRPTVEFTSMSSRQKRENLREINVTFNLLLEKIVGTDKLQKSALLLYHLKRLRLKNGVLGAVVADMESLPDYAAMTTK